MEVAVFISGVADPKWQLPPEPGLAPLQAHAQRHGALSPFDEAALEIALALRDADPAVRITALVAADEALTRRVAGWRPDAISRLDLGAVPRWDGHAVAGALAQALDALAPAATLVLVGREFGDFDDGTVPAALAHGIDALFLPLVLGLRSAQEGLWALRQTASGLERALLAPRALLSATNDTGNRLRHPLMKNVMLAKKAVLPAWTAAAPQGDTSLALQAAGFAAPPPRRADCQWLEGSAAEKADALAAVLLAARA